MRAHIEKWLEWRKRNTNGWFHHLLVLFKIIVSPTFEGFITDEQAREITSAFDAAMKEYTERNCENE